MGTIRSSSVKNENLPPVLQDLFDRLLLCDMHTPAGRRTVRAILLSAARAGVRIEAKVTGDQTENPPREFIAAEQERIRSGWDECERAKRRAFYRHPNHIVDRLAMED